jgi:hypothetical protein
LLFQSSPNAFFPQLANLSALNKANNHHPYNAASLRLFSVPFFAKILDKALNHKKTAPAIIQYFHNFFIASTCFGLFLSIIQAAASQSTSRSPHLSRTDSFLLQFLGAPEGPVVQYLVICHSSINQLYCPYKVGFFLFID